MRTREHLTNINVTFNTDKQFRIFAWQPLPSRNFHYLYSYRRQNHLRPLTLYFSVAWGHIFFLILQLPRIKSCFFTHRIKIFQTSMQTTKMTLSTLVELHFNISRFSLSDVLCLTFRATTNLLTILSFRFQAEKNIVIIESLISFPPMWEWYFWKFTITFFAGPSFPTMQRA